MDAGRYIFYRVTRWPDYISLYFPKEQKAMITYIAQRLKEASTWKGIATLSGVLGLSLSPQHWEAIGAAVVGIIAAIEVFRKEKP